MVYLDVKDANEYTRYEALMKKKVEDLVKILVKN